MFGMGGSEILVILVVALLFLGPDKLPDAATKISKGIRELRKQTREVQQTIENDTEIGGAIRDLKSALRGDEIRTTVRAAVAPAVAQLKDVARAASLEPAKAPDPAAGSIAGPGVGDAPAAPPVGDAPATADAPTDGERALAAEIAADDRAATGEAPAAPEPVAVAEGPRLPPSAGEPHDPDQPEPDDGAVLAQLVRPATGGVARD